MIEKTKAIVDHYNLIKSLPTRNVANEPKYVYLATNNARCTIKEIYIKPGDHVKLNQVIGLRDGKFFEQPIHSTVSGTYLGLEKHFHRSGKEVDYLKIENDFKDEFDDSRHERSEEEIAKLTKDEVTEIIKNCSSVGLGGSSFPTYVKFQTNDPIDYVLINAIECEPYLTADHRICLEYGFQIMDGIRYIMQTFKAKKCYICFKNKYKDLKEVFEGLIKATNAQNIEACPVGNFYPQGWEVKMIESCLGIKLETGVLPSKKGIIDFNVSTVLGIWRAIKWNEAVYERNITITGNGIKSPQNFRVRVGTALKDILPYCGGYVDDKPKDLIAGGPMMGASSGSEDIILTKTVTSIIIMNHEDYVEEPCVRCGSCVYSCPCGLKPVQIMNAVKTMDKNKMLELGCQRCIECGLCTYSCTSKIKVTDYIRRAKIFTRGMK